MCAIRMQKALQAGDRSIAVLMMHQRKGIAVIKLQHLHLWLG